MKFPALAIVFVSFSACSKPLCVNLGGSNTNKNSELKITAKDYLKSYAMCKCVILAYEKDSINLNEGSISFLKEMAEDLVTPTIDSVISNQVKLHVYRKRKGSVSADIADKRLVLADCVYFAESKKMKSVIDSLTRNIRSFPNYWNDKK